jgi:hypothetical protein
MPHQTAFTTVVPTAVSRRKKGDHMQALGSPVPSTHDLTQAVAPSNQYFSGRKRAADDSRVRTAKDAAQLRPLTTEDMESVNEDEFGTRVYGIIAQLCDANAAHVPDENDDFLPRFRSSYVAPELLCPLVMRLVKWKAVSRSVVIVAVILMDRLQHEARALIGYYNVDKAFTMCMLMAAKSLEDAPVYVFSVPRSN